jgi:hypothetical protein
MDELAGLDGLAATPRGRRRLERDRLEWRKAIESLHRQHQASVARVHQLDATVTRLELGTNGRLSPDLEQAALRAARLSLGRVLARVTSLTRRLAEARKSLNVLDTIARHLPRRAPR